MKARLAALVLLCVVGAGCGSGDSPSSGGGLTVSAASSLKQAFTDYGASFKPGPVRFSFAGSDELAAQIRSGIRPDVFAAANTLLPDDLYSAGLVERPVTFARNRLVLAVPSKSSARAVADMASPGMKLAIGSPSVPVGIYTRQVLAKLGPLGTRILHNVRSEEPDVKGVVGKLTQNAVDGGFVYVTDVRAAKGALRAIDLGAASPPVAYGIAVLKGAKHPDAARAFVKGLTSPHGRALLRAAGFGAP